MINLAGYGVLVSDGVRDGVSLGEAVGEGVGVGVGVGVCVPAGVAVAATADRSIRGTNQNP